MCFEICNIDEILNVDFYGIEQRDLMLTDENLRNWDRGMEVGLPVWSNGRGRRGPRGTGYWRTCAGSGGIWYGRRAASLRMLMSSAGVAIRRIGLL